jgi:hypothetical protein
LTYYNAANLDELDITLASLDAPELYAPQTHIWVADKLDWVIISDGLPQLAGGFR